MRFHQRGLCTSFVSGHGGGSGLAVSQAKVWLLASAFTSELGSTFRHGFNDGLTPSVDGHMTNDVQHSMKENNRPIVNVTVRNEGDLNMIKSHIDDMDAKDGSFNLM